MRAQHPTVPTAPPMRLPIPNPNPNPIFMRPSSVGGGRILRRTLSVCLSVRPSRACILTKIGHVFSSNLADVRYLLFCLHLRAAYCRAISRTSLLTLNNGPEPFFERKQKRHRNIGQHRVIFIGYFTKGRGWMSMVGLSEAHKRKPKFFFFGCCARKTF